MPYYSRREALLALFLGGCKCFDDSGDCDWCRAYYEGSENDMSAITVVPHTIPRTIKGYYDHYSLEFVPDRTFDEVDRDFPFMARCGSVSAIGKTEEGAVGMVERILAAKESTG